MQLLFYNLFLLLYRIGALLLSPWNIKARRWIRGRQGIFPLIEKQVSTDPSATVSSRSASAPALKKTVWVHCASLGEFEQGRPVLEAIRESYPGTRIILTFFSSSGYEIRKNYEGADYVFYLPLDSAANASRFVELIRPSLVIWVKYEYWYYYLQKIYKSNISLLLISANFRPSQAFFKAYGGLYRKMLTFFSRIFVQTEESKALLAKIGLSKNVFVSGDTRFDRVVDIADRFEEVDGIKNFCGNARVIVAGSTWEEDEEEIDHFANTHPEIKFIIAPHEITEERLKEVQSLFKRCVLYSNYLQALPSQGETPNVLIVDCIGLLSRLYHYATITYVGGGFGDEGVHNVLEAAVYGKPVIYGPIYEKFVEAKELLESGGGYSIESAIELEKLLNELLTNESEYKSACNASKAYVTGRQGARQKVMQYIKESRILEANPVGFR